MRKSRMSLAGMGALIIASALGAAPVASAAPGAPTEQAARQDKVSTIERQVRQTRYFGIRPGLFNGGMKFLGGSGIPPHIYGMYYVKAGTHKRTNKPRP